MESQTLSVDAIPDGATLAEPLMAEGLLLLPAGAVLTPAVIAHLRKRGIEKVTVKIAASQEEPAASDDSQKNADPAVAQEHMAHLFRYAVRLGQLNPLFHIVTAYRHGGTP